MSEAKVRLVLASASPRRMALLDRIGLTPDLLNPADVDETPGRRESPRRLSLRLAEEKALKAKSAPQVRALTGKVYVLAADTVVGLGRRVLPKAETYQEAKDCLTLLSGRAHWVYSSICLIAPDGSKSIRCVETKVRFKRLSREDLESYLRSEEWKGKAGGYAIQGRAEAFVRYVSGSYSGVVGLPVNETVDLLMGAKYPVQKRWMDAPPAGL
ncbi:MAG: Maf family nucleotide pyrophosphatase [Pseudomonadota bacterium]|nr:Maf family nucleotide pyrophosphatase [Pseudomonadota bacterium]